MNKVKQVSSIRQLQVTKKIKINSIRIEISPNQFDSNNNIRIVIPIIKGFKNPIDHIVNPKKSNYFNDLDLTDCNLSNATKSQTNKLVRFVLTKEINKIVLSVPEKNLKKASLKICSGIPKEVIFSVLIDQILERTITPFKRKKLKL